MGDGVSNQQHRFALEFLNQLPMEGWGTVLDIGAGPGYQTQWFQEHGKQATAFDLSPPIEDVPFVTGDAHELPFENESFDAVWTHHVFEHVRDPLGVLLETNRVLKPNGYLFFTVPDTDGVVSSGHINRYDMTLVVYHLAMCGFDVRAGYFGRFRSHLRAVVRKNATPEALMQNVDKLQLPVSCDETVRQTGRFTKGSLVTTWLDGTTHRY